ncbi:MAG: ABC transporter ATP-binding protein [Deltaproteobacteria bacterium]|nr:ABC transporter ATP-binding protein [Deltaproteobacteria bacterium]
MGVAGVDLEVGQGSGVAVMGPSGCGKTTLLNLVGGIDRASQGRVLVDGTDVTALPERALEQYRLRKVGFIFQMFNLIPSLTALGNLEIPMAIAGRSRDERKARGLALLSLMGIGHKADTYPDQLSGGEQQRVAIALALVNDPPLILADEPTGNLDRSNTEMIAGLLAALAAEHGKTVLMATHDQRAAAKAQLTYWMEDGRLRPTG